MLIKNPKRTVERAIDSKRKLVEFEEKYPEVSKQMLRSIRKNMRALSDADKQIFKLTLHSKSIDEMRRDMMLSERSVKNSIKRTIHAISSVYPHPDLVSKVTPVWEKVQKVFVKRNFLLLDEIKESGSLREGVNLHGNADGISNTVVKLHKKGKSFEEISAIVGISAAKCKSRFNNYKYTKKK